MGTVVAALVLSGCAGPQYTYVRDDDGETYFKVPAAWREIDRKTLDSKLFGDPDSATAQAQKQSNWIVAFDAHAQPSVDHLLSGPSGTEDQPFVFAKVHKLSESEQNQVSLNVLRNSIGLPVAMSDTDRQQLEENPENPFKNFELLADQVLPAQEGVRGVRSVFNFQLLDGPVQTFDETAYLSADGTQISTLLIRCSATCYRQRATEIDNIAQSFKVKRLLNQ
ncbi:hypothetical protein [Microbispora sp. ATCC PTA-5024]|uniref:hypothetical protein n=1 Tax=Microbispora sp. ATCC PTA-5024 TaxID=316330 RepID=UPI0003DD85F7|nr:hypothetical protein [Microbispora sp. ATCC PTA-5024]ETK32548.1 hypothetical protein MPTA5024_29205 [Microbispora sp. ATCC PTA-5024]